MADGSVTLKPQTLKNLEGLGATDVMVRGFDNSALVFYDLGGQKYYFRSTGIEKKDSSRGTGISQYGVMGKDGEFQLYEPGTVPLPPHVLNVHKELMKDEAYKAVMDRGILKEGRLHHEESGTNRIASSHHARPMMSA